MSYFPSGLNEAQTAALLPIEHYLKAHITGNADYVHMAFHADARIISFRDGVLHSLSVKEFSARFQGQPAADEAQRKRSITHFAIAGNAGSATVLLEYPEVTFTDYMNLLAVDGGDDVARHDAATAVAPERLQAGRRRRAAVGHVDQQHALGRAQ